MNAYIYLYENDCAYTYSFDVSLKECRNVWLEVAQEIIDNLLDADEKPNYIYQDGTLRLLTAQEKQELFPVIKTDVEILQQENLLLKAQVNALRDRNIFVEDCISEMAAVVYS